MTRNRIEWSSTFCPSTPGDNPHCPACSHAAYYGEGRDAGGAHLALAFLAPIRPDFCPQRRKTPETLTCLPTTSPGLGSI